MSTGFSLFDRLLKKFRRSSLPGRRPLHRLQLEALEERFLPATGMQVTPLSMITPVSRMPSHLDLFTTGPDGHVYTNSYDDNNQWWGSQWRAIDPTFTVTPGVQVAAVARMPWQLDIFTVGNDGGIWSAWWDQYVDQGAQGSWAHPGYTWFELPGTAGLFPVGTPVTAINRGASHLDVFAVANNGQIMTSVWDASQNNGAWQNAFQVGYDSYGFATGSSIGALARASDGAQATGNSQPPVTRVDLFAVDNAGRVVNDWADFNASGGSFFHGRWVGGHYIQYSWVSLGSPLPGVPVGASVSAVSRTLNQMDIFVVTSNGQVYTDSWNYYQNNGNWTGFIQVSWLINGAAPGSTVSVTARTTTHLDIFTVDRAGNVMSDWWDQVVDSGSWNHGGGVTGWFQIGQNLTSGDSVVTCVNRGPVHLDVYTITYDARVITDFWDANVNNGYWNNWFQIGDKTQLFPVGPVDTIPDWADQQFQDVSMRTLARDFFQEGRLNRNEMISLLYQVERDGWVSTAEFTDLQFVVNNPGQFETLDYVENLASKLVFGNPANMLTLQANIPGWALDELVGQWFLGNDRPQIISPDLHRTDVSYTYVSGPLFGYGISYEDVQQGALGDCWLLASLNEVAIQNPAIIQQMFIDNGDGTFTVRVYNINNNSWDYVTVDRNLPVYNTSGTSVFDHWENPTGVGTPKLWVALAEKAFAQLAGEGWSRGSWWAGSNCYSSLESGWTGDATTQITGQACSTYVMGIFGKSPQDLDNAFHSGKFITFGTGDSPPDPRIVAKHAYALYHADASSDYYVVLNPWGINSGPSKPFYVNMSFVQLIANFGIYTSNTSPQSPTKPALTLADATLGMDARELVSGNLAAQTAVVAAASLSANDGPLPVNRAQFDTRLGQVFAEGHTDDCLVAPAFQVVPDRSGLDGLFAQSALEEQPSWVLALDTMPPDLAGVA
jgi:hypothetical protein